MVVAQRGSQAVVHIAPIADLEVRGGGREAGTARDCVRWRLWVGDVFAVRALAAAGRVYVLLLHGLFFTHTPG